MEAAEHHGNLFKDRVLNFANAYDALDAQVTGDWPRLQAVWKQASLRVHNDVVHGTDINVTMMEAVRICERVGGEIVAEIKEGRMTCPSETVEPLHGAMARLNGMLPGVPFMLMEDYTDSDAETQLVGVGPGL